MLLDVLYRHGTLGTLGYSVRRSASKVKERPISFFLVIYGLLHEFLLAALSCSATS
jgi:hypothetical protein